MPNEYEIIRELTNRYNTGQIHLPAEQAQRLAEMAYQYGIDFEVKRKPFRKMAFDAADMASFGMLPNEWRPRSPGQDLHGEAGWDKVFGGIGTLAGLGTGVGVGIKGAQALKGAYTGSRAQSAIQKVKEMEAINRARNFARNTYNQGRNYVTPDFPNFADFRYPI